ncbi:MAG: double zinc ribbon domain-containing protein, partial [Massilia sp.]
MSRHLFASLRSALLPSACALCSMACDGAVCEPCAAQFLAPRPARCARCANPLALADALLPCGACQSRQPAY